MLKACCTCPILNTFKIFVACTSKGPHYSTIHKNSSRARRIFPCGITKGNDEVNNHFRKFATASKGDNTCNLLGTSKFEFLPVHQTPVKLRNAGI